MVYFLVEPDGAETFACSWDCDADTDSSVPMVANLDAAATAHQRKSADEIIRSATFPAAHAPSPDANSRSEVDCWPRSLAVLGTVGRWWVFALLPAGETGLATNQLCFFFLLTSSCSTGLAASPLYSELTPLFGHHSVRHLSLLQAKALLGFCCRSVVFCLR